MGLRYLIFLLSLSFIACSGSEGEDKDSKSTLEKELMQSDSIEGGLPLDYCIKIYEERLEDKLTAKKLCSCFMTNAASYFKEQAIIYFMEERWEVLKDEELYGLTELYELCFSSGMTKDTAKFEGYSIEITQLLQQQIKSSLEQGGFAKVYDLDIFTNCLVESIQQNYTVGEVISEQIMDRPEFQKLQQGCADKAKLSQ
jgi:hypothetical protein